MCKYKVSFGGSDSDSDNSTWEASTTIEAEDISEAMREFEKLHEGSCSGWGSITVTAIEKREAQ